MKLLIVADGRSPITLNWIRYFEKQGHSVFLASSYPCEVKELEINLKIIPVAFSQAAAQKNVEDRDFSSQNLRNVQKFSIKKFTTPKVRTILRQWLGPATIPKAARQLHKHISQFQPDLVHAMRIPYEGMLTTYIKPDSPLIISVWGNDFTLHAKSNPWMGYLTRKALQRIDGIHTDCWRDLHLAHKMGFTVGKPSIVLPSSGGVRQDIFFPPRNVHKTGNGISSPIIINPRGFRAYVRNDIFFKAIPLVLEKVPEARFICPGMDGEHQANRWITELNIPDVVELLPKQTQEQMGELFRKAHVAVSPTIHDGTPNSLLESMACGCFPIAGDLESIREWITSGMNGLLVNPNSAQDLANAIVSAITHRELRTRAVKHNIHLISERADYNKVMEKAENFYSEIIKSQEGKSR
ncbi:MAG: glycosyltransferase family 4 protein [Anaerolineales bacterium]